MITVLAISHRDNQYNKYSCKMMANFQLIMMACPMAGSPLPSIPHLINEGSRAELKKQGANGYLPLQGFSYDYVVYQFEKRFNGEIAIKSKGDFVDSLNNQLLYLLSFSRKV